MKRRLDNRIIAYLHTVVNTLFLYPVPYSSRGKGRAVSFLAVLHDYIETLRVESVVDDLMCSSIHIVDISAPYLHWVSAQRTLPRLPRYRLDECSEDRELNYSVGSHSACLARSKSLHNASLSTSRSYFSQ